MIFLYHFLLLLFIYLFIYLFFLFIYLFIYFFFFFFFLQGHTWFVQNGLITLAEAIADHSVKRSLETRKVKNVPTEHPDFPPPEGVVAP